MFVNALERFSILLALISAIKPLLISILCPTDITFIVALLSELPLNIVNISPDSKPDPPHTISIPSVLSGSLGL